MFGEGLLVPTSGTIFFKKTIDVLKNLSVFRKSIGLCPQEDRLIPYMTLVDHLFFFGKLKGATDESASAEATAYLKLMNLDGKSDRLVVQLTNVDKRKLSLSCALMGKAEVLILDEPTAGVEDTSRRKIWSLLKELKINRTIIMTSHSMSEAGKIADRIAIMNHGMVVCNGSIDFLKKTFGTGYVLRIVRKRDSRAFAKSLTDPSMQVIDIITRSVGGSRLENRTLTELIFIVPQGASSSFPNLFKTLETQKTALNIEKIHVSYAALEHIFLKLGGESVFDEEGKSVNIFSQISPVSNTKKKKEKILGPKLYFNQYIALFEKKYTFLRRNSVTFFFRVIILTILGILLLGGTRKFDKIELPLVLDDSPYKNTKILMAENENNNFFFFSTFVSFLKELNLDTQNVRGPNMTSALLNYSMGNIASYRREVMFANDLNKRVIFKDDQKLMQYNFLLTLYNKFMRHSLPVAVNIFDNSLLQFYVKNNSYKIITVNHPIKNIQTTLDQSEEDIGDKSPLLAVWFVIMAFLTVDLLDYLIIPVKVERIAGFKHIQFLSGVSPRTYWFTTFIFDVLLYFVIMFLRVALFKPFDDYGFITLNIHIAVMLLLFTLFIISGLLFIYAVSFVQMSKYGSYLFFFIFNILCAFISFTFYTLQTDALSGIPFNNLQYFTLYICQGIILIIPPMNFSLAFQKLVLAWRINYLVDVNTRRVMSNKTDILLKGYQKSVSYLETASHRNPNGILLEIIFLFLSIFLYAIMLYCFELDLVYRFLNHLFLVKGTQDDKKEASTHNGITAASKILIPVPKDVAAEHENVKKIVQKLEAEDETDEVNTTEDSHASQHAVIANGLHKIYWRLLRPSFRAVTDITFATKIGECFGLLGHEGAGSSTILRMLTGITFPTKGEAWVYNIRLDKNRNQYFSKIGYCPESITSYLDELTGRETLEYIATLNGIDTKDIKEVTEKWINILDLEAVQNKTCGTFSEGYLRKICTAMAFIGEPEVVFLDGPTIGIDPFARFKLFSTINQSKKDGQTILFTSHSIGECETLCDRITVLVNGRMRFIGSINDMKMAYAQGFMLIINLKDKFPNEKDVVREENVDKVKKVVRKSFSSITLKHETDNMLQYEIKETSTWSAVFQKTEEIKKAESLIVEYQLTETSLEDVYTSFYETIK